MSCTTASVRRHAAVSAPARPSQARNRSAPPAAPACNPLPRPRAVVLLRSVTQMRDTVATRAAVRSGTALGINPTTLDDLPPAVLREILRRLPADHRARCACVCRRWRDVLSDPALWTVLDLRAASGVTVRVTPARLLAAAARAQGRLEVLNVLDDGRLLPALTAVATANASTLRELRSLSFEGDVFPDGDEAERALAELRALLLAAPALQVLEAMMECRIATACRVLRNEPPFGPLRLTRLNVDCSSVNRDVTALAAALVTHPSLDTLSLTCPMDHPMPLLPGDLDSVVTAALTLRLQSFDLCDCELMGDAVPALSRLLSSTDPMGTVAASARCSAACRGVACQPDADQPRTDECYGEFQRRGHAVARTCWACNPSLLGFLKQRYQRASGRERAR